MPRPREAERETAGVTRLRVAVVIVLGAIAFFLPLDVRSAASEVEPRLLAVYGISAGLVLAAFAATYTAWGVRRADRIAFPLTLAVTLNTCLYLFVSPAYPGLVASMLGALLMSGPLLFGWSTPRVLAGCGVALAGFGLAAIHIVSTQLQPTPPAFAFGVLAVGAGIAVASAALLARMRARLARRHADLAALSSRLMSVQEEERRRLSRELQEELGQSLTAVLSDLWLVEHQLTEAEDAVRKRIRDARHVLSGTLGRMRMLSQLLRPSALDDYGLVPSLDSQLRTFADRHGIETNFRAENLPDRLPPEMETAVYRITQEALTNVARHAQAAHVRVALSAAAGELQLEVADDGVGLGHRPLNGGTGLIAIRERVRALGGSVSFSSDDGTAVQVRLPLGG